MLRKNNFGTALALGMCLGVVFGLLIDDVAMGVAFGPLFGIAINSLRPARRETARDDRRP